MAVLAYLQNRNDNATEKKGQFMKTQTSDETPQQMTVLEVTSVTAKSAEHSSFDHRASEFLQKVGFVGFKNLPGHGISARTPGDDTTFLVGYDSTATEDAELSIFRIQGEEVVEIDTGNALSVKSVGSTTIEVKCTCKILNWNLVCAEAEKPVIDRLAKIAEGEGIETLDIDLSSTTNPGGATHEEKLSAPRAKPTNYSFKKNEGRSAEPVALDPEHILPADTSIRKPPVLPAPRSNGAPAPEISHQQQTSAGSEANGKAPMNNTKPQVSPKEIIELVSQATGISEKDIVNVKKLKAVVVGARKIAIYLMKTVFDVEVKDIMKIFGFKADPSVYVSTKQVAENLDDSQTKHVIKSVMTAVEKGKPIPEADRLKPDSVEIAASPRKPGSKASSSRTGHTSGRRKRLTEAQPEGTEAHPKGSLLSIKEFLVMLLSKRKGATPEKVASCLGIDKTRVNEIAASTVFESTNGTGELVALAAKVNAYLDA